MADATPSIDATDVANAANFLQSFLTTSVPNGDFTAGTALRDLTIGALAAVFAFLRADAAQVRQMQSLNTVAAATGGDPTALFDAVTAILSNIFVTPKSGTKARGFVVAHSSQQTDMFVPVTASFTQTAGIVFIVDSATTLFIPASELVPIVEADGSISDYEFRIPLVAIATGSAYKIPPGQFASFDPFSPYVTYVEAIDQFSGGNDIETVAEVLARAPTALSVRNMINDRSITAVLDDTYPEIHSILVIGMGDPEMQRDLIPGIAPHLALHVGGAVDIYLLLDLVETTFTGTIGGLFPRPDLLAAMFRDASNSFASVLPGDIIRVTAGLPSVPAEFLVVENLGASLMVSDRSPFAVPTDETPSFVSYTIGRIGPVYNDVLAGIGGVPLVSGVTSRSVGQPGRITLPGPVMDILDVAILNPPSAEVAFKSPLDGFEHFPNHINGTPSNAQTPPQGLQFATLVHNPLLAQSALTWMELIVGTDSLPGRFDGLQLRVRYRTLTSFADIDSFVRGQQERTSCAFQLPRGHNPISVGLNLSYKLKVNAPALLDNGAIAQTIVDFINAFDTSIQPIDVSSVVEMVKDTYPTMGAVFPLTIVYTLLAPTGDLLQYQTVDEVRLDPTKQIAGPALALGDFGVSDRSVRYIANTVDVSVQQAL